MSVGTAAVGVPRVFPEASPRRVVQLGFLALFAGIAVMIAALDAGAGAEIVTWPMLLSGLGVGALASQLGSPPGHLDVEVEGRTVYLRGRVEEPGFVDRAVEVARGVDGVAAVINLTVEPESSPASSAIEL